jgi:chemotaxis protein MotB
MKENIKIIVTGEGLRIELLETEKGFFFESGRPSPTENGQTLLLRLAQELGKLPNKVLIEGHTDAKPYGGEGSYSNWELSSDRANSARRLMQANGLRSDQISQVRGFADQRLRKADEPQHASNRRISVIVQYLNPPPETALAKEAQPSAEPPKESGAGKAAGSH